MKRFFRPKALLVVGVLFAGVIVALGLTPNYSCACGAIEDGNKLTHVINVVWKDITGERFFPKDPNSPIR
jgi:hypothetical protein